MDQQMKGMNEDDMIALNSAQRELEFITQGYEDDGIIFNIKSTQLGALAQKFTNEIYRLNKHQTERIVSIDLETEEQPAPLETSGGLHKSDKRRLFTVVFDISQEIDDIILKDMQNAYQTLVAALHKDDFIQLVVLNDGKPNLLSGSVERRFITHQEIFEPFMQLLYEYQRIDTEAQDNGVELLKLAVK